MAAEGEGVEVWVFFRHDRFAEFDGAVLGGDVADEAVPGGGGRHGEWGGGSF
jgi:hypothetical protein